MLSTVGQEFSTAWLTVERTDRNRYEKKKALHPVQVTSLSVILLYTVACVRTRVRVCVCLRVYEGAYLRACVSRASINIQAASFLKKVNYISLESSFLHYCQTKIN